MSKVEPIEARPTPDFGLIDTEGRMVKLSGYKGSKHVVMVFNRSFM